MQDAQQIKSFLKELPDLPGVYRHIDASDTVLYVGKAKNLKKRVSQYYAKTLQSPRVALMMAKVVRTEYTVTNSESEALILENNLIKNLHPRYNILFRDDKTYPFLKFSAHQFPQISFYRGSTNKPGKFFGPYPNGYAVGQTIEVLQRVFRLRTCADSVFQNRSRPCMQFQIKRCSGPCTGFISKEEYESDVKNAVDFLDGKTPDVLKNIETKMLTASEVMNYELAAIYRDQIKALGTIMNSQSMEVSPKINSDIIAIAQLDGKTCINLAMVRKGRHLGDKSIIPTHVHGDEASIILEAFISSHYLNHEIPDTLVLSHELHDRSVIELFESKYHKKVHIVARANSLQKTWLELAIKNAELALARELNESTKAEKRTLAFAQVLGLSTDLDSLNELSIECFDISHTSGEATQASCVVYQYHDMQSSRYRRYNINGITEGDDYAAMEQVLTRRYSNFLKDGIDLPDIVLIDGGKGQIGVAKRVFEELGLDLSKIVGVAKGEGRKVGLETLHFVDGRAPLELGVQSSALMLIASIRDEAHRFAITGMRNRRAKQRNVSRLEDIDGVGPKRRQKLLARFGGFTEVCNASIADLQSVEGISREIAEKIYYALR
ncbi:excinuclease ABC subunit UvrC [Taylorella equigenitalis]|uniref:excinuclease ABC subunit UvrC n=1 Tax=Taylorella equigenitalis TaxID=29575 RepID=UPI0006C235D5|nr:excinuclease ABC subunit UvrC [Taylorella equigenitalis]ASY30598.1 excinuclease ABC subunit C [Taylorella equigenitalis]KOS59224.1 excinuclease ABC subunit C [Taylorella equigenitalis]